MYFPGPAGKSNHRMPFSVCAVPAILADKVYMPCASGSHSRGRELIKCRMPLCGNFGMNGSYIIDAFDKDFSGTRRASAACSTGTGDRGTPFAVLSYPHFGQIRAILRLLPQVTSSGDTELAVGCHIAATRGHSCATVPRCLRYRHSKSFTVQPPLPVYGCFRTLRYLQLCYRRYHIHPQGHANFCRCSSVQIPQIPGFWLLHYP